MCSLSLAAGTYLVYGHLHNSNAYSSTNTIWGISTSSTTLSSNSWSQKMDVTATSGVDITSIGILSGTSAFSAYLLFYSPGVLSNWEAHLYAIRLY